MTKNVLIISSSPRKGGNSDLLCDEFRKGALEVGHQVEKIRLSDYRINFCKACYLCKESGSCFQRDGMDEILPMIKKADVIVLATPVYFYCMAGQLKTMIDRTVGMYPLKNKEFYYIVTSADSSKENVEKVVEALRGFAVDCTEDSKERGVIYGLGVTERGEIKDSPAFKEAYSMAKGI